jgi:short-subunit dehydrogenase
VRYPTLRTVPDTGSQRAVVTGASSGIGAAFARLLAARGDEVVLVGRDRARLETVAAGLGGHVDVVVADLTREDELATVEMLLRDATVPVGLLVNNAGAGWYGPVVDHDPEHLRDTVALNVTALIRLTRAVLPGMVHRGSGGVINVSSVAGSSPSANMATYAATKAFVDSWSASVVRELHGTGVVVTNVKPGYVRSEFHARSGEDLVHVPDAEWLAPGDVARRALAAHARGRRSVVILPEVGRIRGGVRWARAGLRRRAPWLGAVKRAVTGGHRS